MQSSIGVTNFPVSADQANPYSYKSLDGENYILSVKLENPDSPALLYDVDGKKLGIDCEDPVYCVEL